MVSFREQYPLEKIKPLKKTISSFFLYIIIALGIAVFTAVYLVKIREAAYVGQAQLADLVGLMLWVWVIVGLFVLAIILKYVYEVFYLKNYFYDLVGKNLTIRKGVFSRNEITLPLNRLQDVYVDQDILDRIFGLYDVHVSSATAISGYLSHIDGVNKASSEALKELIVLQIHKQNA